MRIHQTFQSDDAFTTAKPPARGGCRWRRVQINALAVVLTLTIVAAAGSSVQAEPRLVADPNTPFHRVYVVGSGDSAQEDQALSDDLNELRADLENSQNHSSLNSVSLTRPGKWLLESVLDGVKYSAQPGDAVTIYLSGRGNEDVIRLRSGVELSAAELAGMLDGFMPGVTRVIIVDSCFGGSFVDDIGGSPEVAVIGTSTTCPIDPPFDDFTRTFAEDIAFQAGQRVADGNMDGVVTAAELETALTTLSWKLGEAGIGDEIENGQSKCLGTCDLPAITVTPPECAAVVDVAGVGFAANAPVDIEVLDQGLELVGSSIATTDAGGVFAGATTVSAFPSLVTATDATNQDWQFCPAGGGAPPDETAPNCELTAGTGVIDGTIQDLESGLAEIEIIRDWNVVVAIAPFSVGTTAPVDVLATIIDPGRTARLGLKAIDVAGNATICLKTVRRIRRSWTR